MKTASRVMLVLNIIGLGLNLSMRQWALFGLNALGTVSSGFLVATYR